MMLPRFASRINNLWSSMPARFPHPLCAYLPSRPTAPPFFLINSHPFRSARSRPGREAAKRTLDGEDRSGIIRCEGKRDSYCVYQ